MALNAVISKERSCAEALMMACDERLGAQSPAALMVCDTFLARDFWTSFVHQSYLPPAASQVWAWGTNRGQLGLGDTEERTTPTEVTALHGRCIHAVACGINFTMAVVDDGELWATGDNSFSVLGFEGTEERHSFTRVSGLSGRKVAAVACGGSHTIALLESGELFAWGWNKFGQLGLGDNIDRKTPEPVAALSGRRVAAIACGGVLSVAVLDTGELFAWGWNLFGQLGLGDNAKRNEPTQVTALAGRRVVAVACGLFHTAAVLGAPFPHRLHDDDDHSQPSHLHPHCSLTLFHGVCDHHHHHDLVFSRCRSRSLSVWHDDDDDQCRDWRGLPWGRNSSDRFDFGEEHAVVSTPQQVHFFDGKRIMSIHCGDYFSGAVLKSGELFLWGKNDLGKLGTGGWKHKITPTLVAKLAGKRVLSVELGNHTIVLIQ